MPAEVGARGLPGRAQQRQADVCPEAGAAPAKVGMAETAAQGPSSIRELAQKPGLALPPPFLFTSAK